MEGSNHPRIAYLRGRPDGHPMHNAYAQAIGATFHYVDELARWHDLNLSPPLRYLRWLQNAIRFPYRRYEGLLIEGPHVWPSLAGKLARIPVWSIVDDHTLYFLYSGFFPWATQVGLRFALKQYTGLFVVG
ncbi:MAG: hypothetical protein ABDH91_08855, partial [Bacteroidia bacterium]